MLPIPSSTRRPAGRAKRPSAHSAAGEALELVVIEPKQLRTSTNLRAKLKLTPEFTHSIRPHGVLEAITARRDAAGDLGIERGHRRGRYRRRADDAGNLTVLLCTFSS